MASTYNVYTPNGRTQRDHIVGLALKHGGRVKLVVPMNMRSRLRKLVEEIDSLVEAGDFRVHGGLKEYNDGSFSVQLEVPWMANKSRTYARLELRR
jgi:hypothetical protein